MKKRFLSLLLAATMLCICVVSASAKSFSDTSNLSTEYRDAINYVSDNGYISGTETNVFSPNESVTRGMLVTVLYRMAGEPACTNTIPFTDVSSSRYYYNPIRWAYANGIANGTTSTTYEPELEVTREEAITFLYRYAQNCGYSTEITNNTTITSAGDYSSISAFAQVSMCWAVDKHIIIRSSTTSYLYPTSELTRKDFALYVTRFGTTVVGIEFGKDNYSFKNSSSNFKSSSITNYYISDSDYAKLENFVDTVCGTQSSIQTTMDYIDANIDETWGGSCFGMSMSASLDKIGKIGFNENLTLPVSTMYAVGVPINNLEILSRINFYQLSFYIPTVYNEYMNTYNSSTIASGYAALIEKIQEEGLVQVSYYYTNSNGNTVGHAVVAYACNTNSSGDYELSIYDPNSLLKRTVTIESDYSASDFSSSSITKLLFTKTFTAYDAVDYDGSSNTLTLNANSTEEESYTTIIVPFTQGACVITNAEGECLYFANGEVSDASTMTVLGDRVTFSDWLIYVENSDSYTIEGTEGVDGFGLMNAQAFVLVDGSGIDTIEINSSGVTQLAGDEMEFSMAVDDLTDNTSMRKITGSAPEGVVATTQNNQLDVLGMSGSFELTEFNGNSTHSVSMASSDSESIIVGALEQ